MSLQKNIKELIYFYIQHYYNDISDNLLDQLCMYINSYVVLYKDLILFHLNKFDFDICNQVLQL